MQTAHPQIQLLLKIDCSSRALEEGITQSEIRYSSTHISTPLWFERRVHAVTEKRRRECTSWLDGICDLFKKEGLADAYLLERGLLKRGTACWIVSGSNPGKLTQRRHCDRREEATLRVPSHRSAQNEIAAWISARFLSTAGQ
jgi:hypothetical protein